MTLTTFTSLQRVSTALGHQEPDRVPFFLLLTVHGARELNLSIRSYFSKAENVVEGQLRMRTKYSHDCLYPFYYAAIEVEAWGGEVIYYEDGPPNAGEPFIKKPEDIRYLEPPQIDRAACLKKVLLTIEILKDRVGDDAPIIGVVMSPFSLPVMQMGFDKYIELIYRDPDLCEKLMRINEVFCVQWANLQLNAGATAICYFDPVSSSSIIPRDIYRKTGFRVAKRTLAKINGPTATHLASAPSLEILEDIAQTGTAVVGVSALEDLAEIKKIVSGRLSILGNLNGIMMSRWTAEAAEANVKEAIAKAGVGGGFILSDNHGEIPWQVSDTVLHTISETVHQWGRYPLKRE
ncbi:MAG: uroporphyrinogen decarboxylase family protein [Desulfobacterales bacterium]|nr:uroporphyrinogen decarboxylase family protein [Desulfobacterales bacterium]